MQVQAWAAQDGIGVSVLLRVKKPFAQWLKKHLSVEARDRLLDITANSRSAASHALWPVIRSYVREHHAEELRRYAQLLQTADMTKPHLWFPLARGLTRRVVYHAGPTNSGKTYEALQALKAAASGVYCGPLRLLAVEIAERLNADGVPCDLLTGQERLERPGATHTACTVEMVSMSQPVDVAVIDEIQMMADQSRGWAWSKALLGVPAAEVHVCGDYSCLDLVRNMCAATQSVVEVREYQRMTALDVDEDGLGDGGYAAAQPGDAIVAFSRRDIYAIKAAVERESGHKAAVIYGALPPHTRRAQAALFNDPESDFKVLVASDAIGMGLNLNIRRIIFHSLRKYNSALRCEEALEPAQVKQIAGRAGRRGTVWENGLVTTFRLDELPRLRAALALPVEAMRTPAAGLLPEFDQLELYAQQRGYPAKCSFSDLIELFGSEARQESEYFLCNQAAMLELAAAIDGVAELTLRERFAFCTAPVQLKNSAVLDAFLLFVSRYAAEGKVELDVEVPLAAPDNWAQISFCETVYQIVSTWLWLSNRFGDAFPDRADVQETEVQLAELINEGLQRVSASEVTNWQGEAAIRLDITNMVRTPGIRIPVNGSSASAPVWKQRVKEGDFTFGM